MEYYTELWLPIIVQVIPCVKNWLEKMQILVESDHMLEQTPKERVEINGRIDKM